MMPISGDMHFTTLRHNYCACALKTTDRPRSSTLLLISWERKLPTKPEPEFANVRFDAAAVSYVSRISETTNMNVRQPDDGAII
jgi:hypothetical protein